MLLVLSDCLNPAFTVRNQIPAHSVHLLSGQSTVRLSQLWSRVRTVTRFNCVLSCYFLFCPGRRPVESRSSCKLNVFALNFHPFNTCARNKTEKGRKHWPSRMMANAIGSCRTVGRQTTAGRVSSWSWGSGYPGCVPPDCRGVYLWQCLGIAGSFWSSVAIATVLICSYRW